MADAPLSDLPLLDVDALGDADGPPAAGATDAVGLRERLLDADTTVDAAARGDAEGMSLDEARTQLRDARSALAALGYEVDGGENGSAVAESFGPDMAAAVTLFQEEHELEPTRELDAVTYEALMSAYEQAVETGRGTDLDAEDDDELAALPDAGF